MATLAQLGRLRRLVGDFEDVGLHKKKVLDAALQAVEDWFEAAATKQAVSDAIDAATAPVVLPNPIKRRVALVVIQDKVS